MPGKRFFSAAALQHPLLLQRLRDDLRHLGVALGREVPDGAVGPVDVVLPVDRCQGTALGKGLEQINAGNLGLFADRFQAGVV
jgi:hypothetical protein